jgi:three-Cys-motif partner protein
MITVLGSLTYPFGQSAQTGIACAPNADSYGNEASIPDQFFDETRDQSQAKAAIVSKYFWAWASVIIPTAKNWQKKIAYIDLFAGPGRYKDGTVSTPLLVLRQAIEHPDMRDMLVTVFNDYDAEHVRSLQNTIKALPGIEKLKYEPEVNNEEVGSELVRQFEKMQFVPTLFFVDPWGYKGLSLRLVNSVLKDWGCDCIFFFNYNRISMGLANEKVEEHMNALFGEERANKLRKKIEGLDPEQRELTIIEELVAALKDMGGKYVLPFRFKNERGVRTSHHLIFVSKHPRGYGIMKDIMAGESSRSDAGVASFEYNPSDHRQPHLFEYSRPLDDLCGMLIEHFKGRSLTVKAVFEEHNVDRPYISRNYKDALRQLEVSGDIVVDPPAKKRQKRKGVVTMADGVTVSFPQRRE